MIINLQNIKIITIPTYRMHMCIRIINFNIFETLRSILIKQEFLVKK
jgi:hypothetical protein